MYSTAAIAVHFVLAPLLAQLVLRDNDIQTIPKELYKCTRLVTLHLQVNQINVLPPEISKSQLNTRQHIT